MLICYRPSTLCKTSVNYKWHAKLKEFLSLKVIIRISSVGRSGKFRDYQLYRMIYKYLLMNIQGVMKKIC